MSNQNNSSENSTLEMETKENFNKILNAISDMREEVIQRFDNRFDKLEEKVGHIEAEQALMKKEISEMKKEISELDGFVEVQFEAVRQGIVERNTQFNQLISEISQNRSAIFSTKAAVGEMQEKVYLLSKNIGQPI